MINNLGKITFERAQKLLYFQMPLKLVEVLLLLPLLHPQQILAKLLNGLETITVMMRTTMRDVAGMAETVAETMSTPNFALHVNVWIQMAEEMILLLLHHHPQEMILLLHHPHRLHHLPHRHHHLQEIVVCITF